MAVAKRAVSACSLSASSDNLLMRACIVCLRACFRTCVRVGVSVKPYVIGMFVCTYACARAFCVCALVRVRARTCVRERVSVCQHDYHIVLRHWLRLKAGVSVCLLLVTH